jgi:lipopolysaccharide export system protein LptA
MAVARRENSGETTTLPRRRQAIAVGVRARLPVVTRILALMIVIAGIAWVGVSYYKLRNNKGFVMIPGEAKLDTHVVSEVFGYERRVTEGDRLKLLVKATKDITFADGHHELEDVTVQSFPDKGDKPDQITAHRSIYDQETQIISFAGDVNIETRDALKAHSEQVVYNQKIGVAESNKEISFSRENVSGRANSGIIDSNNKKIDLHGDVSITVQPDAKIQAQAEKEKAHGEPITVRATHANFDQNALHLAFSGGATAEQGHDVMSGDNLNGVLGPQKKLQKVEVRGNSYLRSMGEGRAAEVHSKDMDFFFSEEQKLTKAVATNEVTARSLNAESQAELSGSSSLDVNFVILNSQSLLNEMRAGGRTTLRLGAPQSRSNDPRAANKQLTADAINLFWRMSGRDLERAEAIGNAELIVDPVQKSASAEKKTLAAPRFDCSFFETGNLAQNFVATGDAKALIEPYQSSTHVGVKTLTSKKMTAVFARDTQDVERFDAEGSAKFNELDRNGTADNLSYIASNQVVRLRGGEPIVWDSRARTKANEIDSDLAKKISYGRGKAATTYYSQEQTNGAAPFSNLKSPVYVTADKFEFQHDAGVAVYTGNARLWQDDNFVRGDSITLFRDSKRMESSGHVQSALYQANRRSPSGAQSVVPVFGAADGMSYSDPDRVIHYEGNVDIRQGTDRVTSEVADAYLLKDKGEVDHTVVQRNVVVTQPGRRGTGLWGQYTAADDSVVLKGDPARVEDAEQGTTQSGRLTMYLRENRIVADDTRGPQSAGRVHSTHKVQKGN